MLYKGDLVCYRDAVPADRPMEWPVEDLGVVIAISGCDTVKVQWQKSNSCHRYLREELILVARAASL